jgi:hypothetical protein
MPVAGEDAILEAPAMERKPHVRAAVVQCNHVVARGHDKYRATWRADYHVMAVT